MDFHYTKHAVDKLNTNESRSLKISKKVIAQAVISGEIVEIAVDVITKVSALDERHSFCVVYRKEKDKKIIITFFAAKKGRYERKILQ